MESMHRWLGLAAALGSSIWLGACATFDVKTLQSRAPNYVACMQTPRGFCDTSGSVAQNLVVSNSPSAIVTSPPASFLNPFAGTASANPGVVSAAGPSTQVLCPEVAVDRSVPSGKATMAEGVDKTRALLGHPFQQRLNAIHAGLQSAPEGAVREVKISGRDLQDYIGLATHITNIDGWSSYRAAALCNLSIGNATTEDVRRAVFMEAYLKAYFRSGEFGDVQFRAADLFKEYPDLDKLDPALKAQLRDAVDAMQKHAVFGKIGTGGFVTRVGTTYQIAPIQVTIDPTRKKVVSVSNVNYSATAADIVRVLLEAIYDAHDMLPAVWNATGVTANIRFVSLPPGFEGLDVFDAKDPGVTTLSEPQFEKVTAFSNSMEGAATAVATQFIRGIGPVALNNESIAEVIETAIGVIARKVGEKASYCWYSCKLDALRGQSVAQAAAEDSRLALESTVRVTVSY